MPVSLHAMVEDAMSLPAAERTELAFHLLQSVDAEQYDTADDPSQIQEIQRRLARYQQGEGQLYDEEEVLSLLKEIAPDRAV